MIDELREIYRLMLSKRYGMNKPGPDGKPVDAKIEWISWVIKRLENEVE